MKSFLILFGFSEADVFGEGGPGPRGPRGAGFPGGPRMPGPMDQAARYLFVIISISVLHCALLVVLRVDIKV